MSIARSLLLRASRSPWLAGQFRRRSFARRAVRRFMPGEGMEDALRAAAAFSEEGIGTILTQLGERVTAREEAEAVRGHYLGLLGTIQERGLPAQPSVKLTHLGLDLDREACVQRVAALAARAGEAGSRLWIDMEESEYVDATLDVFRRVRAEHESVGVCLQAYLRRTPADLESLLPLGPAIRLVKGAYREPAEVAFPKKADTDRAYLALAERLLEQAAQWKAFPVFGTHDLKLVERIRERAQALGVAPGAFEVHMLYGIQAAEQRALARARVIVRVLISYGENWFPWYMRRLAERPANVWFVVKNLLP
ncbi:MAG TPA: proline dehydrogenase family protein [Longimicrobiaceae bacterium]|nr:proline dehydrogenase family protein [Longimicrobiaceae bacterium]